MAVVSRPVNVRPVCATNADLPAMVAEDKFRADLLDRLAFDVVQLPPLRERRSDIMLLADQFAIQMCRELGLPLFPGFSKQATETLLGYHWPGNIRELKTWWNGPFTGMAAAKPNWTTLFSIRFVARINSPGSGDAPAGSGVAARFTPVPASAGTKLARAEPERGEI